MAVFTAVRNAVSSPTTYHSSCAKEKNMVVHNGPFLCHRCRGTIAMEGVTDIMEDYLLLDYLFQGTLPTDVEEI